MSCRSKSVPVSARICAISGGAGSCGYAAWVGAAAWTHHDRRCARRYVDQEREGLDPKKTVYEAIGEGDEEVELGGRRLATRAYCAHFNFRGADQQKAVGVLSGGERNRLNLARVRGAVLGFFFIPGNCPAEGSERAVRRRAQPAEPGAGAGPCFRLFFVDTLKLPSRRRWACCPAASATGST